MIQFAEVFPDEAIVSTLSRQLAWSHLLEVIYLKDFLQRDFYAAMCRLERWSVRTLCSKIRGMLYARISHPLHPLRNPLPKTFTCSGRTTAYLFPERLRERETRLG